MRELVSAMLLLMCSCSREPQHLEGKTMSTTWRVTADNVSAQVIQNRLDELEQIFSNWRPDSAISKWNASQSTKFQPVPREVAEVMEIALKISAQTDGAMDVTVSPLVDLWGFGAKGTITAPPSDAALTTAKSRCGYQKLELQLDPPMLRKTVPSIEINLSTLVEGYAADELAKLLSSKGCTRYLIDVGGAIVAHGQTWNVGVQTPNAPDGDSLTSVPLKDMAVTTAGIYRKHFEADGFSYPHIIDPRTGRPIGGELSSVSVFNERAIIADGWDTALMVLGPEQGRSLATKVGIRGVFVLTSVR